MSQVIATAPTPDYTLSASPTSATVQPGSSATFTITLTPSNGYNGTVALGCGTLPAGVTCTFAQTSLTPSNNQPITSTLTVKTMAATASLTAPPALNQNRSGSELLASLGGMGQFGFILLGDAKRSRSRMGITLGVVVLVMILGLVGCGGSSKTASNNGSGGGTPAGSYTMQLTASGTAGTNGGSTVAHSLNISITVQ